MVKDGVAVSYNTKGEELSRQVVPNPDYSEYIAEIKIAKRDLDLETKAGVKRDINWLREKMESHNTTKSKLTTSYKIYAIEGDIVVLEQNMGVTKSGDDITVRTLLSSNISKNYGYEQLEGGVLKVRCTNYFDKSSTDTKSCTFRNAGLFDESPSRTVVEMLSYLADGTPMISVSDKEYKDNIVKFNIQ